MGEDLGLEVGSGHDIALLVFFLLIMLYAHPPGVP